jgi:DNA-binding CsgD family transcriptional regulator
MTQADTLAFQWITQLEKDLPNENPTTRNSILRWLLGEKPEHFATLNTQQYTITSARMDFVYRILQPRYLGVSPEVAYRNLIGRLGGLVMLRQKIKSWVSQSRDRHQTVVDVLQEVIPEMLNRDRDLQQQMTWIAQCTNDSSLRNSLLLATLEEYCLRPIRNQPLLVYRFLNYLKRTQRGGLTQVPQGDWVKLISEEMLSEDNDESLSFWDTQAFSQYQESQIIEEQQAIRQQVQKEFAEYLEKEVDPLAAQWLHLYLQGKSQDSIAQALNIPIKQIYRLREKVSYHAIRVFAVKQSPQLVANWLEISLKEHNLGLTPRQWQQYWQNLSPQQRQLLELLKEEKTIDSIAHEMKLKTNQVISEWSKLYLAAQTLRTQ